MKTDQILSLPQKIKWMSLSTKETPIVVFLYLIFFLFLVIQHSMVFPYHDDWGVAVLDYVGEQTGFSGQNFKFSHVLGFLSGMYENWSGRVFSMFLEIYLLKFGFWYVRLFQILAILGVLFYSMRIAIGLNKQNKTPFLVIILPIILYLSLPPGILIGGIYWFAAASGYLWGVPIFLLAAHSILNNKKITIGSSLLLAISASFHEQMGFAAITFYLSYTVYDHFLGSKKQPILEKIYFSAPLALIAAVTIFAPGNFARKNQTAYVSDSLYEIIRTNLAAISEMFFSINSIFFWILLLSFISLSISSSKSLIRSASDLLAPCFPATAILVSYFLLPQSLFAVCFVGLFSFVLLKSCRLSEAGIVVFSVFIGSLGALATLLFAPGVPWRSGIPFYLLIFVPIQFSIIAINESKFKYIIMAAFVVIFIFSLISSVNIFNGFRENYKANVLNHYQLIITNYKIRNNIDIGNKVTLFKLPSPIYAETMPYQRPLIEKWIKKYYELPQDINFDWR